MWHLIKYAILIIIGLLILSFFGISIQSIIESPAGQANLGFLWNIILTAVDWLWELIKDTFDFIIFWN